MKHYLYKYRTVIIIIFFFNGCSSTDYSIHSFQEKKILPIEYIEYVQLAVTKIKEKYSSEIYYDIYRVVFEDNYITDNSIFDQIIDKNTTFIDNLNTIHNDRSIMPIRIIDVTITFFDRYPFLKATSLCLISINGQSEMGYLFAFRDFPKKNSIIEYTFAQQSKLINNSDLSEIFYQLLDNYISESFYKDHLFLQIRNSHIDQFDLAKKLSNTKRSIEVYIPEKGIDFYSKYNRNPQYKGKAILYNIDVIRILNSESILLSFGWYMHPLGSRGWYGVIIIKDNKIDSSVAFSGYIS